MAYSIPQVIPCDAEGTFQFWPDKEGETWIVQALSPQGYSDAVKVAANPETAPLELVLRPGGTLQLSAVIPSGAPEGDGGCEADLIHADGLRYHFDGDYEGSWDDVPSPPFSQWQFPHALPPGNYVLLVRRLHEYSASMALTIGRQGISAATIQLDESPNLYVHCSPPEIARAARITVTCNEEMQWPAWSETCYREGGIVFFSGLPASKRIRLCIRVPGYAEWNGEVDLPASGIVEITPPLQRQK